MISSLVLEMKSIKKFLMLYNCASTLKTGFRVLSYKTLRKKKRVTVLKSPHVNKKAKRQFVFYTYKAVIKVFIYCELLARLFLLKISSIFFQASFRLITRKTKTSLPKTSSISHVFTKV